MINQKQFGKKIRFYRRQLGITQSELADKIHVSFQAISGWECGNTLPDIENLYGLSVALGISIDALFQKPITSEECVLLGIDGGGTSTEFALFTSEGRILKHFKLSGSNASTIGLSEALAVFYRGIDLCLTSINSLCGIFMGCAGGLLRDIEKVLSSRYPTIPIRVDSDGVSALLSADGDAAIICGTGSLLLRHDGDGGYKKFGGWGSRYGDPGSAYNFGREAISLALAYEDGAESSALIYSMLKERSGFPKIRGNFNAATSVAEVADQARVIFDAYREGDGFAEEIIRTEMKRLSTIVRGACPNGGRIVACGSINKYYGHILLPILKEYVSERIEFILPELPPIYGACREACRCFGVTSSDSFFKNFYNDYQTLT